MGRWDATWYEIDERGFRGPGREVTGAEGEFRVACVGDSCTFGKGVLEADTWPRKLEGLLRERAPASLVFNLGINGGNGEVYLAYLEQHIEDLRPDVVALEVQHQRFPERAAFRRRAGLQAAGRAPAPAPVAARHDGAPRALPIRARGVLRPEPGQGHRGLRGHGPRGGSGSPSTMRSGIASVATSTGIRDLAAEYGAPVVVFLFPYESQVLIDDYDRGPIERLAAECGALDLPFFDLAEEFRAAAGEQGAPPSLFVKGDRYHPNAAGYSIVARRVLAEFDAIGVAPLTSGTRPRWARLAPSRSTAGPRGLTRGAGRARR